MSVPTAAMTADCLPVMGSMGSCGGGETCATGEGLAAGDVAGGRSGIRLGRGRGKGMPGVDGPQWHGFGGL